MKTRSKKNSYQPLCDKKGYVRDIDHKVDAMILLIDRESLHSLKSEFQICQGALHLTEAPNIRALQMAQLEVYEDHPQGQTRSQVFWDQAPFSINTPGKKTKKTSPAGTGSHSSVCDQCEWNSICSNIKMGLTLLESSNARVEKPQKSSENQIISQKTQIPLQQLSQDKSPGPQNLHKGLVSKLSFYRWDFPIAQQFCNLRLSPTVLHKIVDQLAGLCHTSRVDLESQTKKISHRKSDAQCKKWREKTTHPYEEETHHE